MKVWCGVCVFVLCVGLLVGVVVVCGVLGEVVVICVVMVEQQVVWNWVDVEDFMYGYKDVLDIIFVGSIVCKGYCVIFVSYCVYYVMKEQMGCLIFFDIDVCLLLDVDGMVCYVVVIGCFYFD